MKEYFPNVGELLASDFSSFSLNYNDYVLYLDDPLQVSFNFEPVSD